MLLPACFSATIPSNSRLCFANTSLPESSAGASITPTPTGSLPWTAVFPTILITGSGSKMIKIVQLPPIILSIPPTIPSRTPRTAPRLRRLKPFCPIPNPDLHWLISALVRADQWSPNAERVAKSQPTATANGPLGEAENQNRVFGFLVVPLRSPLPRFPIVACEFWVVPKVNIAAQLFCFALRAPRTYLSRLARVARCALSLFPVPRISRSHSRLKKSRIPQTLFAQDSDLDDICRLVVRTNVLGKVRTLHRRPFAKGPTQFDYKIVDQLSDLLRCTRENVLWAMFRDIRGEFAHQVNGGLATPVKLSLARIVRIRLNGSSRPKRNSRATAAPTKQEERRKRTEEIAQRWNLLEQQARWNRARNASERNKLLGSMSELRNWLVAANRKIHGASQTLSWRDWSASESFEISNPRRIVTSPLLTALRNAEIPWRRMRASRSRQVLPFRLGMKRESSLEFVCESFTKPAQFRTSFQVFFGSDQIIADRMELYQLDDNPPPRYWNGH